MVHATIAVRRPARCVSAQGRRDCYLARFVDAIRKMTQEDAPQLVAAHGGALEGLLTRAEVVRFVDKGHAIAA